MSPKQLGRRATEFTGCQSIRELEPLYQMAIIARGMDGRRLRHQDLKDNSGLSSGARAIA